MTEGPLAILGPGTLGLSLAQWAAECGLETRLLGRNQHHAEAGRQTIQRRWDQAVAKGRLSPEARREAEERLTAQTFAREALEGVSALLEALPEDPMIKGPALAAAAGWGALELLLLSGTSSLRISGLALAAGLPNRLVGFHLFVPVPRMAVVEMGVAPGTPELLVARTRALGHALRKRVVQVRDQPGFAAARMGPGPGP